MLLDLGSGQANYYTRQYRSCRTLAFAFVLGVVGK